MHIREFFQQRDFNCCLHEDIHGVFIDIFDVLNTVIIFNILFEQMISSEQHCRLRAVLLDYPLKFCKLLPLISLKSL